jgi:hypothetical protein
MCFFHNSSLSNEGLGRAGLRYRSPQMVENNKKVFSLWSLVLTSDPNDGWKNFIYISVSFCRNVRVQSYAY